MGSEIQFAVAMQSMASVNEPLRPQLAEDIGEIPLPEYNDDGDVPFGWNVVAIQAPAGTHLYLVADSSGSRLLARVISQAELEDLPGTPEERGWIYCGAYTSANPTIGFARGMGPDQ